MISVPTPIKDAIVLLILNLITALISIGIVGFLMAKNKDVFIEFIKESKKHLKTKPENYFYGVSLSVIFLACTYLLFGLINFLI